jgi:hypothetical protein
MRILQSLGSPVFKTNCKNHDFLSRLPMARQLRRLSCESKLKIHSNLRQTMIAIVLSPLFAAASWSLLYLLCGGGLGGAILIFIVLKMIGK